MEKSVHKSELFRFLLIAQISQRLSYISGGGVGGGLVCGVFFYKTPKCGVDAALAVLHTEKPLKLGIIIVQEKGTNTS